MTVGLGLYRARMRSPCAGDALTPLWKVPKKTLSLSLSRSRSLARSLALSLSAAVQHQQGAGDPELDDICLALSLVMEKF